MEQEERSAAIAIAISPGGVRNGELIIITTLPSQSAYLLGT
jgi:hypothetical protein